MISNVTIIGSGLIGGSFLLALKKALPDVCISVVDKITIKSDYIEHSYSPDQLESALKNADLIYLATNVQTILEYISRIGPFLKKGVIITDAGSTKQLICEKSSQCLPKHISFIGGHPMTGSHQKGFDHAAAAYFQDATYLLTPTKETNSEDLEKLSDLIHQIGSQTYRLNPIAHDIVVANISHLPQILSLTLMNEVDQLNQENHHIFQLAGGGLKDMTRIASSSYDMWKDIFHTNSDAIVEAIDYYISYLQNFKKKIKRKEDLTDEFHKANTAKKLMMEKTNLKD